MVKDFSGEIRHKHIIFGANSYVGGYIYNRLKAMNCCVVGTSRRNGKGNSFIEFDICDDVDLDKFGVDGDTTALVCLAEANIDICHEKPEYAYNINVVRMKVLLNRLIERRVNIVFLSSDNVFDGQEGGYTEIHSTNPINRYGAMKAEIEEYLMAKDSHACIFRLSKVVGDYADKKNPFTMWEDQMKNGEIPCIKDNIISFVCQEDIYQAYTRASKEKLHGIYHISGDIAYSRKELAEKFLFANKRNEDIHVREYELPYFHFKDNRPLNVSLDNRKFKHATGYDFTGMEDIIDRYVSNRK